MNNTNDAIQRWQKITIDQMTFVTNLILVVSLAVLGFTINQLSISIFVLNRITKVIFGLGNLSIIASICLSIYLAVNRLNDFRLTTKKLRHANKSSIELNKITGKLGNLTWSILNWQIGTFIIGLILLIISFGIIYHNKLI